MQITPHSDVEGENFRGCNSIHSTQTEHGCIYFFFLFLFCLFFMRPTVYLSAGARKSTPSELSTTELPYVPAAMKEGASVKG